MHYWKWTFKSWTISIELFIPFILSIFASYILGLCYIHSCLYFLYLKIYITFSKEGTQMIWNSIQFFFIHKSLCHKLTLSYINMGTLVIFWLPSAWSIFFSFHFLPVGVFANNVSLLDTYSWIMSFSHILRTCASLFSSKCFWTWLLIPDSKRVYY